MFPNSNDLQEAKELYQQDPEMQVIVKLHSRRIWIRERDGTESIWSLNKTPLSALPNEKQK